MTETWNEIYDRVYREPVDVDGNHFINCRFETTQLRYGGGQLPRFENCHFENIGWYFHDAALRTIQLLQFQNQEGGAQQMLDDLFRPGNILRE
ncbi:MAG TPA: hypothetical protein VEC11_07225 [Allosphingosinicella sp.]|nr:hypothetical protein [Allosphingosinicella sp.]